MNKEKGLKQQIKDGEISPKAALEVVLKNGGVSPKFVRWVRETGVQRYNQALAEKSKTENSKKKG